MGNISYNIHSLFKFFDVVIIFNETVKYSKINKKWITLMHNKLTWKHEYAELKHVIDNITLSSKHHISPPLFYNHMQPLSDLNCLDCTKYEKFTSDIVNSKFIENPSINNICILHWKNIRGSSTLDKPLIELKMMCVNSNNTGIYNIKNFETIKEIFDIIPMLKKKYYFMMFTDWRDLYRNGYSCIDAKVLIMQLFNKELINKYIIVSNAILVTDEHMYSINIA